MQITVSGCPNTGNYITSMSIIAGETVAQSLSVASGGGPINLTGYTLKMQINFPTPLLLSTANGGITITDPTQGQAQINIAESVSAGLTVGRFAYEFWMISGGGAATPLLTGLFTVNQMLVSPDLGSAFILLEDGGSILTEDGQHIILEQSL